jgi:hypothetical protein
MVVLGTVLALFASSAAWTADKSPTKERPAPKERATPKERPAPKVRPATKKPLPPSGGQPQLYGGEAVIEQALATPTDMEFTDMPLTNVLEYLADYHSQKFGHRFEIQIDTKALNDAGIAADTPVTKNLKGITLRSALNLMLRDLNLTWTIKDEVLLITTPEEAENHLTTKVLDVADLVVCRDSKGKLWNDYDSLIDMIKSTVMPTTWDDVGGPGSICPADVGAAKALVICQTYLVQGQIADMLAKLRAVAKKSPDAGPPVRDKEPAPPVRDKDAGQHKSCAGGQTPPGNAPKGQGTKKH